MLHGRLEFGIQTSVIVVTENFSQQEIISGAMKKFKIIKVENYRRVINSCIYIDPIG